MNTLTEPLTIATRYASTRYRSAGYWLATVPVVAELGLGGAWDIGEVGLLAVMTALTVLSWALRPPSRRMRSPQRES